MPSSDTPTRKLAAIMFTDISGYTAQMSKDESKALNLLKTKESILKPLIKKHNGTYVKSTGDGSLSYFPSAIDAAICSVKLQEATFNDDNMNIRVGIHLGDIVFKGDDVFGDGVNVAARIESIAPVGGVCVSKNVYDELVNKEGVDGVSLGLQSLKGVGRLIEVFGLKGDKLNEPNPKDYQENKIQVHSDDEVPSVAIIPFDNKGKEEDVFYAYGISADLISDVSSGGLIRVASLKQIEEFGDLPVKEKAEKLDVRYIATGTLWKMGEMFQLSIELYDTNKSKVVWSDRWQEKWDNLPTIKINLSDGLLKALDTTSNVEKKVETTNTEAYEFYLKAKYKYEKRENTDDTEIARGLYNKAIKLDDNLISAKVSLGWTYSETGDYDKAMDIYTPALKQAEELGDKNGIGNSLNNIGIVCQNKGDYDKALDFLNRSLEIKEELDDKRGMGISLNNIGNVYANKGDYDKALDHYGRSLAIQEELGDKRGMGSLNNIGNVYTIKGDYDKALDHYGRSLAIQEELGDKRGIGFSQNNIGTVYLDKGDNDKALDYYGRSLAIAEELGDKRGMGYSLSNIGNVYKNKGDYDKALDYYGRSLEIKEELGNKRGMGHSLMGIGEVYEKKGDYDIALDYYTRSIPIQEEIGDKRGMTSQFNGIGVVYTIKGDYDKALDYYGRSLAIAEELGDKRGMGYSLMGIGNVYWNKGDFKKAEEYLQKSLAIQKEIGLGTNYLLMTTAYLYLSYKQLGKVYDEQEIQKLIKETENIEADLNYVLYQLLEDTSYLETAYNEVQESAESLEDKAKFLSYPIPKAIVKKWEKNN